MGLFDGVEVYETFSQRWVGGYEVADRADTDDAYWVRRQTDGSVLPATISADRIRPANSAPPL